VCLEDVDCTPVVVYLRDLKLACALHLVKDDAGQIYRKWEGFRSCIS